MFFQSFLKGIAKLSQPQALDILLDTGILCRWRSNAGTLTPQQVRDRLTWRSLDWHLNHYDEDDPDENDEPFCEHTPFISTTAGTVERDASARANYVQSAFRTALSFATLGFTASGHIFYGYVYVLGKKSIALEPFAEEVRDLHIYTGFLPYHHEGEIAAKIHIPCNNLEKCEEYDGPAALHELDCGRRPTPGTTTFNPHFAPPEQFTNVRHVLD
jgi:hypothetical protein